MRVQVLCLLLFSVISGSGCGEKGHIPKPENLISENRYIKLMVEVQLLDAYLYTTDSLANFDSLKLAMFDHYQVTEEQYRRSNAYYQSNINAQIVRLDSVQQILKREIQALKKAQESEVAAPFVKE